MESLEEFDFMKYILWKDWQRGAWGGAYKTGAHYLFSYFIFCVLQPAKRWQRRGWSCYTLTLNLRNIAIRCCSQIGCYLLAFVTQKYCYFRQVYIWMIFQGIAGDNWSSWKISWKWKCNSTGVYRTAWQVDLMMIMMTMCTGPLEHHDSHCCHRTTFSALVQKARRWHTQTEESSALYRWERWQIVKLWFAKVRWDKLKETWKLYW